jgi:hypothetical protein
METILERQSKRRIKITGVDPEGEIFMHGVNPPTRFNEPGARRTEARIYSFIDYVKSIGEDTSTLHFMTLTVRNDRKRTYDSRRECLLKLRRGFDLLRMSLSKRHIEYLRVYEPGEKNGYPHIHLILVGASNRDCESLIRLWLNYSDASPKGQEWSRVDNIEHAGAYLRKYLVKTYDIRTTQTFLAWAELCYREGIRTFGMSKGASDYINNKYRNPLRGLCLTGEVSIYGE